MVYVISGINATEELRQLTCAPESGRRLVRSSAYSPGTGKPGPLIGWPIRTVRPGGGGGGEGRIAAESVEPALLTRADVFVIWERNV